MSNAKKMFLGILIFTVIQVLGSTDRVRRTRSFDHAIEPKRRRVQSPVPASNSDTDGPNATPGLVISGTSSQSDRESQSGSEYRPGQDAPFRNLDPTALGMGILCRQLIQSFYEGLCKAPYVIESGTPHDHITEMHKDGTFGYEDDIYALLNDLRLIGNECAHHTKKAYVGDLRATCQQIDRVLKQLKAAAMAILGCSKDRSLFQNILLEFRNRIEGVLNQAPTNPEQQRIEHENEDLRKSLDAEKTKSNAIMRELNTTKTIVDSLKTQLDDFERITKSCEDAKLKLALETVDKLHSQIMQLSIVERNRLWIAQHQTVKL